MTPTVTSDVEVANLALDMLKEAPITSMTENRTAARWMNRNFVPVRNLVTIAHVWKFAMHRATLAADAVPPEFDWKYQYRKPADCLRVLPLRVGGTLNGRLITHIVENDYILTNAPAPLYIRYLRVIPDPSLWPPTFVDAVAAKLAAKSAHLLTGKQSMVELANANFTQALQFAASIDSAEGTHAQQYATTYDDARYYSPAEEY
jgi:hypothetical protein